MLSADHLTKNLVLRLNRAAPKISVQLKYELNKNSTWYTEQHSSI